MLNISEDSDRPLQRRMCAALPLALPPSSPTSAGGIKTYDYLLKFLLVGDSDVGKEEIMGRLSDGASESPYGYSNGIVFRTTTILLDGKRVKLQLWDTSGQGRFCTIFRSYSRGAQGVLLVFDITNRWSFDGIDRWIKEIDEHAPGVPKILIGNRLHLAYKRQVTDYAAVSYAAKNNMTFFEVSPLCDFNITESLAELARVALHHNGMSRSWGHKKVLSLQEFCCRCIATHTTVYGVERLPLPGPLRAHLKSYLLSNRTYARAQSLMRPRTDKQSKKNRLPQPIESHNGCRSTCCIS